MIRSNIIRRGYCSNSRRLALGNVIIYLATTYNLIIPIDSHLLKANNLFTENYFGKGSTTHTVTYKRRGAKVRTTNKKSLLLFHTKVPNFDITIVTTTDDLVICEGDTGYSTTMPDESGLTVSRFSLPYFDCAIVASGNNP